MIKNLTSIIDFGSSKITVLSGVGDVNKSVKLMASVDVDYAGFAKGEFLFVTKCIGMCSSFAII